MGRRIASAAIMLAIVLLGFAVPFFEPLLVLVTGVIAVLCTMELCDMMKKKGLRVYRRIASWGVIAMLVEAVLSQLANSILVFGLAVCLAWVVRMPRQVSGAWGDISATCFTMAYVGIPFAAIVAVFLSGNLGQAWLLLMLTIIWTTDSAALFVGRALGRTKLSPRLSPGKTLEGALGGVIGALLVVAIVRLLFNHHFEEVSDLGLVLFALFFSILSQVGDLAESMLKRDVGVKDSGSELTGHGGFLDLMDAVMFCAVPLIVYLKIFQPHVLIVAT
jgi:phosphatidate cytidylyltransferase